MTLARFKGVEAWVFDLDNTLYPASCNLFAGIDQRMGAFIAELLEVPAAEARRIQKHYYHTYGTTLAGLMARHAVPPERFLAYVHDIDLGALAPDPALCAAIADLPGRKFIFTNGSVAHATRVAAAIGFDGHFEAIHDIAAGNYVPKPSRAAFEAMCAAFRIDPHRAAMVEDLPANLEAPHALGMATVLVRADLDDHPSHVAMKSWAAPPPYVDVMTDDLCGFLRAAAALTKPVAAPDMAAE